MSGCWNRGVPLYTEFGGVEIHHIQRMVTADCYHGYCKWVMRLYRLKTLNHDIILIRAP